MEPGPKPVQTQLLDGKDAFDVQGEGPDPLLHRCRLIAPMVWLVLSDMSARE